MPMDPCHNNEYRHALEFHIPIAQSREHAVEGDTWMVATVCEWYDDGVVHCLKHVFQGRLRLCNAALVAKQCVSVENDSVELL